MKQQPALPKSIQEFVEQQNPTPLTQILEKPHTRSYPYGEYWWRAVAGMLLSGRIKPNSDGFPNMTDANRICKEANFNQYSFERLATFLVTANIIAPEIEKTREYMPGEYAEAFWHRNTPLLQQATRKAFLSFIGQFTRANAWRPTFAFSSGLDLLAALFAAAFTGLALQEDTVGATLLAFSQLPREDLQQLSDQIGWLFKSFGVGSWESWLDLEGQKAFLSALYICRWAYVSKYQELDWFFMSPTARILLGLENPPEVLPAATEFKALPNLCVFAGTDLPPEKLVPLFRYCKIKRIDRILEFQFDKRQFKEMPSRTPGEHELRIALKDLEPLPSTLGSFLKTKTIASGEIRIRGCSAIVQPENQEILTAIKEHRRLKGYLEAGAPDGYLLIKSESDPHQFIIRCQELGFTVKRL